MSRTLSRETRESGRIFYWKTPIGKGKNYISLFVSSFVDFRNVLQLQSTVLESEYLT